MQEEKMVSVIGIGPGGKQWLTQEAEEAIRRSDLVVGYTWNWCGHIFRKKNI